MLAIGRGTTCSFLYLRQLASVLRGKDPDTLQPGQVVDEDTTRLQ